MLTLYYVPRTRAGRARWMLEELGVPYQIHRVDLAGGENRTPEYLATRQPLGRVPVLLDGDTPIFESAAIVAYLADRFPEKGLAPPPGSVERGPYLQWMFYAMAEIEPYCFQYMLHTSRLPEDKRNPADAARAKKTINEHAEAFEHLLADGREYLLGRFTAADVVASGVVSWGYMMRALDAERLPRTIAWVKRMAERDAWKRARAD
jgi:glutathione S-transferase